MPRRFVLILAWSQLVVSFAIASATVYGYVQYEPSLRQATRSAADGVRGVSDAIEHASEAIEARRLLLTQVAAMLVIASKQIDQLEAMASSQARFAPQYAEGLRSTSGLLGKLSATSHAIAAAMKFEVPTGVELDGKVPVIMKSKPLEASARELDQVAEEMSGVGTALSVASASLAGGAKTLDITIAETGRQARILIAEIEKTIKLAASKDLPSALADLKKTSESLRAVSQEIHRAEEIGVLPLVAGLLFSLWCLLNSVTTIGLASAVSSPVAFNGRKEPLQ